MAKLTKQKYYSKNGIAKINCYYATISKDILAKSGINSENEIIVYAEKGKIIIEEKK